MRAVGYQVSRPIEQEDSLVDIDLPMPQPGGRDILVEVRAVSVNPVDTKVRKRAAPEAGQWKVLGWDAAGTVQAIGPDVRDFAVGDAVYYAGAIGRPGSNSQYHLVDERIVGRKPATLDWAQAAAIPLTAITAWEMLFDRLDVRRPVPGVAPAIVVIGGAGGVGSLAIQLARALTGLTVIGTASRPETSAWVRDMGAHHVLDHRTPLAPQVAALGIGAPGFVFCTTQTGQHLGDIAEMVSPQGRFGLIDDPATLDILPFKFKSVSVYWEMMFTRAAFTTADMAEQGKLLNEVAGLIDRGTLRTTVTERLSPINAVNLRRAHALIEGGRTRGKIVLEGFAATAGSV